VSTEDKRKIRVWYNSGWVGAHESDWEDLPEDWDDWSESEQEDYLDTAGRDMMQSRADYGAEVIDDPDEYHERSW
jgi:hypothetical protein